MFSQFLSSSSAIKTDEQKADVSKEIKQLTYKNGSQYYVFMDLWTSWYSSLEHLLLELCEEDLMIKNGLSVVVSDVGGFSSPVAMGSGRFFNAGGRRLITTESSFFLMKRRDMFRAGDIPNMFRGRQTGGCVGSFVPHQCNKRHMLPYFARSFASSSASQSSGQTPRQEPEKKKKKECQIKRSTDEISSTEEVSLNQFPGLMTHGNVWDSKTRHLLRLNPDTGYFEKGQDVSAAATNHHGHYELRVPHTHVCRGSAYGWLFLTDDNLNMKLLNPFSGAEIQLPPVTTLPHLYKLVQRHMIIKAVFSANPSIEPRPVVLIIYEGQFSPILAFCKPGDKGWTQLEFSKSWLLMDVIYHKGQFYVLGAYGCIAAFDIGRCIDDDDHSVKTIIVAIDHSRISPRWNQLMLLDMQPQEMRDSYLVVLDGELFKFELRTESFHDSCIDRTKRILEFERNRGGDTSEEEYWSDEEEYWSGVVDDGNNNKKEWVVVDPRLCCVDPRVSFCTYGIKIRRLDVSEKQWVKVESLGDKAVFLGYNTSFAISASDYPAGVCIPDSVYFTYSGGPGGYFNFMKLPFYDMGIYNVKDKSVKPLYPPKHDDSRFIKPAPIWIVNSADS